MIKIRRNITDWDMWVRPYVKKRKIAKRKSLFCFSITSVPFKVMLKNAESKTLKWNVSGVCKICGVSFQCPWNNMWLRKRYKGIEVCGKCVRKAAYTKEWKKNNSEAQKKVQGTPEARKRMSDTLKKKHKEDPSISRRISARLKKAYRDDPEYRAKVSRA